MTFVFTPFAVGSYSRKFASFAVKKAVCLGAFLSADFMKLFSFLIQDKQARCLLHTESRLPSSASPRLRVKHVFGVPFPEAGRMPALLSMPSDPFRVVGGFNAVCLGSVGSHRLPQALLRSALFS